jgi:hypothetical protein
MICLPKVADVDAESLTLYEKQEARLEASFPIGKF